MEHDQIMALIVKEKSTIEGIIRLNAIAGTDVGAIALQELDFLSMHMIAKPFIAECLPETIIQAIKYSLKNNLSLDPNAGLVYLMPTSVQIGGTYKKALEVKPTAEGKISIAKQCGTILDNKRPVITKNEAGKVTKASVEILLPSIPSPRWENIEIDESDFDRLKKFSHIKNARTWRQESGKPKPDLATLNHANPLYTSFNGGIDPEFARSKVVSAALKKRGTNLAARLSDKIIIQENKEVVVEAAIEKKDPEFTIYEEIPTTNEQKNNQTVGTEALTNKATENSTVGFEAKTEVVNAVPIVENKVSRQTPLFPDDKDL